MDAERAVYSEF